MEFINHMILHAAGAWWIYPVLLIFCLIDGFFPVLPSETLIVALAAVSVMSGQPNMWLTMLAGALGAIIGDNIAYVMGRTIGTTRFKWMRKPKAVKALHWARYELDKRGAMLIFTARYIPVGRVAVNFTAGATGYPRKQFVLLDIGAALTWVGYSWGIGTVAGHWVHEHPLLGAAIAIVFAIVIGFVIDHVMQFVHRWHDKRLARSEAQQTSAAQPANAPEPGAPAEPGPGSTPASTSASNPATTVARPSKSPAAPLKKVVSQGKV